MRLHSLRPYLTLGDLDLYGVLKAQSVYAAEKIIEQTH